MANVVQLKDNTQGQVFPVTKERAVYNENGTPAINKPLGTSTVTFDASESAVWRIVRVPISLSEGYYRVRVSGILDHVAATAQARISDTNTFNLPDTIKLFFIGKQIETDDYEFSFYVNGDQASSATYLIYAQNTEQGGTVTVDIYNADQIKWQVSSLDYMTYKPISVGSKSRKPLASGSSPSYVNCYVDVKFKPGLYVIKTHVCPSNLNDVSIRLNKAHTLNTPDLVKWVFRQNKIEEDRTFYINISEEESELITCVIISQYTELISDLTLEVFPVDQLYWRTDYLTRMFEPIVTTSVVFTEAESALWRSVYIQLPLLDEGYYTVKINGVLDQSTDKTQARVMKARNFNADDTVQLLYSKLQINSTEYTFSFYLSESEAALAKYFVYTQLTALGGEVTAELYKSEQVGVNLDSLNRIIYKPLYSGAVNRDVVEEESWSICYVPVILGPGRYAVKSHVGSTDTTNVMIRLNKARSINGVDLVKVIFKNGTIARDQIFYIDVTPEEAALATYLLIAQKTAERVDLTIEIFSADQLYWNVDQLKNGTDIALPSYYHDNNWLSNRLELVNNYSSFIHGISFPFITDLHFMANALNSKYLLKEVLEHTACSMVICGGDFSVAYGDLEDLRYCYDTLLDYAGYVGHDKWFSVIGNHDFHITESSTNPVRTNWTWGKTYNAVIKPSERWQVRAEMTGGYYCIDNDIQKTRFVMLNNTEPTSGTSESESPGYIKFNNAQLSWLTSVLLEHSNYHIIVISHMATDPDMPVCQGPASVQACLEAFRNKTTYSDSASGVTADFRNTTNEFICHINGHCHSDDSHMSNNVLSISTTCDARYNDDGWGGSIGSVTEQAIDVFCIDYDARTIKAVRFGRGENRSWTY